MALYNTKRTFHTCHNTQNTRLVQSSFVIANWKSFKESLRCSNHCRRRIDGLAVFRKNGKLHENKLGRTKFLQPTMTQEKIVFPFMTNMRWKLCNPWVFELLKTFKFGYILTLHTRAVGPTTSGYTRLPRKSKTKYNVDSHHQLLQLVFVRLFPQHKRLN